MTKHDKTIILQTWKDIKQYILKKEAKRRSYTQGTGGGSPPRIAFSDFEEKVLHLLTPEAAGLENIPEGGISSAIHNINCDAGQINDTATENMEIRHASENERNMEMDYVAGEIEEEEDAENMSPNYSSTPARNARKGK